MKVGTYTSIDQLEQQRKENDLLKSVLKKTKKSEEKLEKKLQSTQESLKLS